MHRMHRVGADRSTGCRALVSLANRRDLLKLAARERERETELILRETSRKPERKRLIERDVRKLEVLN